MSGAGVVFGTTIRSPATPRTTSSRATSNRLSDCAALRSAPTRNSAVAPAGTLMGTSSLLPALTSTTSNGRSSGIAPHGTQELSACVCAKIERVSPVCTAVWKTLPLAVSGICIIHVSDRLLQVERSTRYILVLAFGNTTWRIHRLLGHGEILRCARIQRW